MARTHARIFSAIWSDPEWTSLTPGAQWLYQLILSQPKMTLTGCLDYKPVRWAKLAADTKPADIETWADELETRRYVVIDRETDELLVRTFVRHDSSYDRNSNLLKGIWRAWGAIESGNLRRIVVDNMPDEVWQNEKAQAPETALQMRRSPQSEPPDPTGSRNHQSEPPVGTTSYDYQSELSLIPNPESLSPNPEEQTPSPAAPLSAPPLTLVAFEAEPLLPSGFDAWWVRWPKGCKIDKQDALKAWKAARGKGVPEHVLLEGLDRWCAHWAADETDPKWIPHPTTWLHKRRWEATPRTSRRPSGRQSSTDARLDVTRRVLADLDAQEAAQ